MKLMINMNSKTDIRNLTDTGALRRENSVPPKPRLENAARERHPLTYRYWKAIFDRAAALAAIVVLSPLIGLIALAIKLDSPGKIVFAQERVGKGLRRFVLYKFRSMHGNHDDTKYYEFLRQYYQENLVGRTGEHGEDIFQLLNDPRVTRVGALLRKTNLDELPQLFNILKGDMSFVGPRPDIPFSVEMYERRHLKRFDITPGLTGLWQISGRKNSSFEDQVRLDFEYMEKQSIFLDIKIFILTLSTFLGKHPS